MFDIKILSKYCKFFYVCREIKQQKSFLPGYILLKNLNFFCIKYITKIDI